MIALEEFDQLNEILGDAITSASISITRTKEMVGLHPSAGNEKYLPFLERNKKILQEMKEMLSDIEDFPEE